MKLDVIILRVLQQMIRMNLKHKDAKNCEIFIKFDDKQLKINKKKKSTFKVLI